MRTVQRQRKAGNADPQDLSSLIVRVKYYLWNEAGKPLADPHAWLCIFLCNEEKVRGKVSNWTTFFRTCKRMKGEARIKVTKADVWRSLVVYLVVLRHPNLRKLSRSE